MPTPTLNFLDPSAGLDQVKNYIIKLQRDLTFMLENLDELNINRLDAKVVVANTITGDKISANTITADKMNVDQLSAITADMGTLTAGTIIGALIETALSGQRVELSSTENLLKAINSAGATVSIKPNVSGTPAIEYDNGIDVVKLFLTTGTFSINTSTTSTSITIASGGNINLSPLTGGLVKVPSWDKVWGETEGVSGKSLQEEFNGKANVFSGYTGSISVITSVDFVGESTSSSTLHFSNGILDYIS